VEGWIGLQSETHPRGKGLKIHGKTVEGCAVNKSGGGTAFSKKSYRVKEV